MNIYPDPSVKYDIIVKTMDATRKMNDGDPKLYIKDRAGNKEEQEYLFPDVVWMGVLS